MGDLEILKETIQTLELAKNDLLRLYSYGLTQGEIRRLCSSVSVPGDQTPLTITPIGRGEYGSADLLEYKGKQYIRKSQPIALSERQIDQLQNLIREVPENFSLFENEIEMLRELNMNPRLSKYVPVYYGHEREAGTGTYLMEFIQGESLEGLCDKRGLNQKDLDTILEQINTILNDFHKEGYVFADATAPNFLIRMDERNEINVVCIDFGLTARVNPQKIKDYEKDMVKYQALKPEERFLRPLRNRGDPGINWEKLEGLKLGLQAKFGLPACVRVNQLVPPLPAPYTPLGKNGKPLNRPIEFPPYKPRDFERKNPLTAQQEAQIEALDGQISELKFDLARKTAVPPSFVGTAQFVRPALTEVPVFLQPLTEKSKYEETAQGVVTTAQRVRNIGTTILKAPGKLLSKINPFTRGGKRKHKQKQKRKARKTRKVKH